jgi:Protein of unknown function DUF72
VGVVGCSVLCARTNDNSVNSLALLESRLSLLGDKAGPILFQLPPQFEANADRLASFLKLLSKKRRYSFEFRHASWYDPRILRMLAEENISLCLSDHHDAPAPWKRTADFVYVRGHGPGGRYKGHYSAATLSVWAIVLACGGLSWRLDHRPSIGDDYSLPFASRLSALALVFTFALLMQGAASLVLSGCER